MKFKILFYITGTAGVAALAFAVLTIDFLNYWYVPLSAAAVGAALTAIAMIFYQMSQTYQPKPKKPLKRRTDDYKHVLITDFEMTYLETFLMDK